MNDRVRGVVVCHGGLAGALVQAVHSITGLGDSLVPVSNDDCDREAISRRITEAIGSEPAVVFVDMPTGSCMMAALRELEGMRGATIVTGVNLPMLIDFVFHSDPSPAEAAQRAKTAGAAAIKAPWCQWRCIASMIVSSTDR